ncbi:MAG: hypothetical protein E2598_05900 [Sphingobium sp.]|nr:hypothetical protein [Sphingobium sp.]
MYSLIDQPTQKLCRGSHFLLWAMRGWIHAMEKQKCPPAALGPGFSCAGLLPALPHFNQVMALLNRNSLENIAVAPMPCRHILEDEAILLALWRDMTAGLTDSAQETLTLLVEEEVIPPLYRAMMAISEKMAGVNLPPYGLGAEEDNAGGPDRASGTVFNRRDDS